MTQTYTIGELAKEFGITPRAIRFYEDKGLLKPSREGQKRIYSPRDRVCLTLIMRGKRLGLSLEESRELISLYDPVHGNVHQLKTTLELFARKEVLLDQQLLDIEAMKQEITVARARCETALAKAETGITQTNKPAKSNEPAK